MKPADGIKSKTFQYLYHFDILFFHRTFELQCNLGFNLALEIVSLSSTRFCSCPLEREYSCSKNTNLWVVIICVYRYIKTSVSAILHIIIYLYLSQQRFLRLNALKFPVFFFSFENISNLRAHHEHYNYNYSIVPGPLVFLSQKF